MFKKPCRLGGNYRFKHMQWVTQEKTKSVRGFFKSQLQRVKNRSRVGGPHTWKKTTLFMVFIFQTQKKILKRGLFINPYVCWLQVASNLAKKTFLGWFMGDGCSYMLNCRGSLTIKGRIA